MMGSPARRVLLCGVLILLAQEARSLSSLQLPSSPKLLPGGWPAFLTAPRLSQPSWAAGAPLPCCRRIPWVPPRVLPWPWSRVANGGHVPWALLASGGRGQDTSAQVERDAAWDQRLEELRLFAMANGGVAHVPTTDPERPELGRWCDNKRTLEKRSKLRPDRKARLLEIGFVFDLQEAAWDQSYAELRLVAEANGGVVHVSTTDPERAKLGVWCHNQRTLEKLGKLRADRKARLREIRFGLDHFEAVWEQSLEELRLVAKANGGVAHVPRGDPERRDLGKWCNTQRQLEKTGKLRADRKALLLQVGFVFDLQEAALQEPASVDREAAPCR